MKIGFFFWPFNVEMTETMARHADTYGYDMVGIADTAGNAMDPWVAAALVARQNKTSEISICVTNFVTRHPAVSAAAIASLDLLAPGRAVLGIGAGYIIGDKDPLTRGVPPEHREGLLKLVQGYSTRPGAQNIQLVKELGLYDYLARRMKVLGTPDECFEQAMAPKAAGVKRLMFSVSVALDPVEAVRLFGEKVLPRIRAG